MSRPQAVPDDASVDVIALAHAGARLERRYAMSDLPRLVEAGALEPSSVVATLSFAEFDGRPTLDGELSGTVTVVCQRCMGSLAIALQEHFELIVVRNEADAAAEIGGREPVIADPAHLDLRWQVEDQALLALPLVPMHEPGQCEVRVDEASAAPSEGTQRPFGNLRDLLRQR